MVILQDSFLQAFTSMTHVGENVALATSSTNSREDNMAIHELSQMVQKAESVIHYTFWIFKLTTAALGLCDLSLVCFLCKPYYKT